MKISKVLITAAATAGALARWASPEQTGAIEKLSPAIDQLIAPNAQVEKVATAPSFTWTEGPVWVKPGFLLFAEIPTNSIRKWTPGGSLELFMQPSGYEGTVPYAGRESGSNGMTLDNRGRLTVAGHARRSVWRLEDMKQQPGGKWKITVLADSYQGKRLNSPNDLVYKSDGSLYFTDPPYGLPTQSDHDPLKQLQVNGVYRIKGARQQPAGTKPDASKLELLIRDLPRPNGIAFSPDEKYLYVANSDAKKFWMRYPVKADGSVEAGMVFCDGSSDRAPGAPDGMKVDTKGNLYSAGPGGVWVFSPDGKHLGTIKVPEPVGNVAFGDADGKALYITASSSVYRIHVAVTGIRP